MIKLIRKGVAGPCSSLFNGKDSFKAVVFTDTHLDDKDGCRACAFEAMQRSIGREKPDLIIFMGDNVTGGYNKDRLEEFCDYLDSTGIFWCPVLGNHEGDNPLSLTRSAMVERMSRSQYCLMDAKDYGVHLCDRDGKVFETLFFLDTGTDMTEEEKKAHGLHTEGTVYQYLDEYQISMYRETAYRTGTDLPSVVFGHIPLCEYVEAYREATKNDTEYLPGNGWIYGYRREEECCSEVNSGMFDAMLECGSKAFFCGHDHINDYIVRYKGITLGYGLPGCYSSYNVICKRDKIKVGRTDKLIQGYCVFEFAKGKELKVDHVFYDDIFPDMRERVMSVIRR